MAFLLRLLNRRIISIHKYSKSYRDYSDEMPAKRPMMEKACMSMLAPVALECSDANTDIEDGDNLDYEAPRRVKGKKGCKPAAAAKPGRGYADGERGKPCASKPNRRKQICKPPENPIDCFGVMGPTSDCERDDSDSKKVKMKIKCKDKHKVNITLL